jgi:hypothetical protein
MFCHIGLQATTAEVTGKRTTGSSEHEYGTCMIVLRHILAALYEMFSLTLIMADG